MKKIRLLTGLALVIFAAINLPANAQTPPVAQTLTYTQNFLTLPVAATALPAGLQGWFIGTAGTTFRTNAPVSNVSMLGNSSAASTSAVIHNYNQKVGMLSTNATDVSFCLAINTVGKTSVQVNFDVMTIRNPFDGSANTAIVGVDLQYIVGSIAGTWTSVSGLANGVYQNNTTSQVTGTTPQNSQSKSLTLPAACDNQSSVFLRWVIRDISGTVGTLGRPSFAFDNIAVCTVVTPTISISGPSGTCSGQTLLYGATITNGGATPSYQWKRNGTNIGTNINTFSSATLVAGDQISCVLTPSLGCYTSSTATSNTILISSSTAPTIPAPVVTNVSCAGIRNGAINITPTGGTGPYSVSWDTTNITNGPLFAVTLGTKFSTVLPVGIGVDFYVDGIELKELFLTKGIPYVFTIAAGGHPFSIQTDIVGATSAFILTSGLNPPGSIGSGNQTYTPNNFHPTPVYYPCAAHQYMGYIINLSNGYATEDLTNLKAGKYATYVVDSKGCTATGTYTVAQGSAVISGSVNNSSDPSCFGKADGKIVLNTSGGTAPYTSSGNGPTMTVIRETKNHSHPYFGTGSGIGYTVDGVQGKELTLIRGYTYAFSVASPGHPFYISTSSVGGNPASEVTNGVTNSMVTSGTLFFTPNASHPNLLYYQCGFHNNMGWKINIIDQGINGSLNSCMAGTYSNIKVTDANGCSSSTFTRILGEPPSNTFYFDNDLDFYGTDGETALACDPPPGFVSMGGDCIDNDASINPGAPEICNGHDDNCDGNVDEGCPVTLTLKIYLEGYYSGGGLMDNGGLGGNLFYIGTPGAVFDDVDTVFVSAMDASSPYSEIEQQWGILQTDGTVSVTFSFTVVPGNSYFIRVQHRNTITTWSKFAIPFDVFTNYDFTSASSQAFDDGVLLPMKLVDTSPDRWAFYTGDIDHDGSVNSLDMTLEENNSNAAVFGYYSTDLTGNGASDALDMTIIENNGNAAVFEVHP